jgi:hypothetical protein
MSIDLLTTIRRALLMIVAQLDKEIEKITAAEQKPK